MKYQTTNDALACPVIGSYAKRVAAADEGYDQDQVVARFSVLPLIDCAPEEYYSCELGADFIWHIPAVALYYLCSNPSSAPMLDLSVDELMSLYKCGSHMAGVYAVVRDQEETYEQKDMGTPAQR